MIDLGIVPDRLEATVAAIRRAREASADVLVTSGGASVGDYDLVQKALAAEGLALSFWQVALRPGRPMMHGRLGAMQVLGLPGNPVSAYRLRGAVPGAADPPLAGRDRRRAAARESAMLGRDLPANDERADYMRATLVRRRRRNSGRDAVPGAGLLHDGAARKRRLPRHSRAIRAGRQGRQPLCDP